VSALAGAAVATAKKVVRLIGGLWSRKTPQQVSDEWRNSKWTGKVLAPDLSRLGRSRSQCAFLMVVYYETEGHRFEKSKALEYHALSPAEIEFVDGIGHFRQALPRKPNPLVSKEGDIADTPTLEMSQPTPVDRSVALKAPSVTVPSGNGKVRFPQATEMIRSRFHADDRLLNDLFSACRDVAQRRGESLTDEVLCAAIEKCTAPNQYSAGLYQSSLPDAVDRVFASGVRAGCPLCGCPRLNAYGTCALCCRPREVAAQIARERQAAAGSRARPPAPSHTNALPLPNPLENLPGPC